ncbi:MAG: 5-carboxymethyl-2-hydroxymuconate isomerase [Rhodospirillaceae bacterium]|nr:5-carboxymethyl-2-hydroxymuconate isomerase [Rhodospirillaceae bacterium]
MPHIIIEYSENLEDKINLGILIEKIHISALDTGVFPLGGLRIRAAKREHYKIADGHPDNVFIHIELKIGPGRDKETKTSALKKIFATAEAFLKPIHENGPLAMSAELNEFNSELRINHNNIHKYVEERANA